MKKVRVLLAFLAGMLPLVLGSSAHAVCALPYTFLNGTVADATQVNANFTSLLGCINTAISGGIGNVNGPSSSVLTDVAIFNNTAGTLVKGTAGDFAYSTANGFSMGYQASPPTSQPGKLTIKNTNTATTQTPYAFYALLDNKTSNGNATNPDGIYGDLWYRANTTFNGLGAAIRGNAYTIPVLTAAVASQGSGGYTNGDTITIAGGTCNNELNTAPQFTLTVSAGAVTSLTFVPGGACGTYPSNPVSVTGGTGTGLTLNLTNLPITVTYLAGVYGRARHTSTGTVTNSVALFADGSYNSGGGTLTNSIGLWLQPSYTTHFSNSYGIWQAGAFAGGTIASANGFDIVLNPGSGNNVVSSTGALLAGTAQTCATQLQGGANGIVTTFGVGCYLFLNAQTGGQVDITVNSFPSAIFTAPASGVNYIAVAGNVSLSAPGISSGGSDPNIGMTIAAKGTGLITTTKIYVNDTFRILQASPAASDACSAGQIAVDTGFLYTCAASGTWKRVAVAGGY